MLQDEIEGSSKQRPHQNGDTHRTNSFSNWEALHNVWTAAEVIKAAGYPLEQHTVITSDDYKLRMERLPRTGALQFTSWLWLVAMHPDCCCSESSQLFVL